MRPKVKLGCLKVNTMDFKEYIADERRNREKIKESLGNINNLFREIIEEISTISEYLYLDEESCFDNEDEELSCGTCMFWEDEMCTNPKKNYCNYTPREE